MKTKICTKCHIEKELSEFYKHKSGKDGIHPICKICILEISKKRYKKNRKQILKRDKIYRNNNKEKRKIYNRKHYQENKDNYKDYQNNNKIHIRVYNTQYKRNKRKDNIQLRLTDSLRTRIHNSINRAVKSLNTMFLIGCEIDYLMFHLQSQFTKGMSWDNYGDWHVDHIKPCAKFDLSKPAKQRLCFNYTNLQPLWAIDNLRKGNKYEEN